jgi:hypothetical protein
MVKKIKQGKLAKSANELFSYLHDNVNYLNNSKVFAGCMIIILNIASKFVNIKLGKALESYLKFTFSKQILVFAIAWMGTRDIYIALIISIFFIVFTEYLLNEDSRFCCLPKQFRDYHISLLEGQTNAMTITDEEINKVKDILEKARNSE